MTSAEIHGCDTPFFGRSRGDTSGSLPTRRRCPTSDSVNSKTSLGEGRITMGILRKLGATVTAVAFVGVGALTAGTTAHAATATPAAKTVVAVPQKAVAKTKYI